METTAQIALPSYTQEIVDEETGEEMKYWHTTKIPTNKFENDGRYRLQIKLVA